MNTYHIRYVCPLTTTVQAIYCIASSIPQALNSLGLSKGNHKASSVQVTRRARR